MFGGLLHDSIVRRAAVYGYSNARIGAMKASLLKRKQIEDMVNAREVGDVVGLLDYTAYKEDLAAHSLSYSGADLVELAIGRNLARTGEKLIEMTPQETQHVTAALLDKWDINNLKIILSGKEAGYSDDHIKLFMVPAGSLKPDEIEKIIQQPTVEDVVNFLGDSEYGRLLGEYLASYKKGGSMAEMFYALDAHHYRKLARKILPRPGDEAFIVSLMKEEIGKKNIMDILRGKKEGVEADEIRKLLLPGGIPPRAELDALAELGSVEEVLTKPKSKYDLAEAYERYSKDGALSHFEIRFEKMLMQKRLNSLGHSVLSIGKIVWYLYMKENEAGNIRKIIRAKEFGMPPEKIMEMLVFA